MTSEVSTPILVPKISKPFNAPQMKINKKNFCAPFTDTGLPVCKNYYQKERCCECIDLAKQCARLQKKREV